MQSHWIRIPLFVVILAIAFTCGVQAQNVQSSSSAPPQTARSQDNMDQPDSRYFTGTIVKKGDTFVLRDLSGKVSYDVDDDNKVKDYVGKRVKISGTLDVANNVIHVDAIEVVS